MTSSPTTVDPKRLRLLMQILNRGNAFIYHCFSEPVAGVFMRTNGISTLVCRIEQSEIDVLAASNAVTPYARTARGVRYRPEINTDIPQTQRDRRRSPTAADRRKSKFLEAEKFFCTGKNSEPQAMTVNLGESPLGWLSKRRDAEGRPFLSKVEVEAGERLRADFERAHFAPSLTQDWRKFMAAGASEGSGASAQERSLDSGSEAAKERVMTALGALGPGLSDVAFRTCCFLEGLETVEKHMAWSARSGKIVLKIALQRLAQHYDFTMPPSEHGGISTLRISAP